MSRFLDKFMYKKGGKGSGISRSLAQQLVFINSDKGNTQFKMYNQQTGEITFVSDEDGRKYVTHILGDHKDIVYTQEFKDNVEFRKFATASKIKSIEVEENAPMLRSALTSIFILKGGVSQNLDAFERVLPERYQVMFSELKSDINKLLSKDLDAQEVKTMQQDVVGDVVEDPALHAAITQDDKNAEQEAMTQLKEAQIQQMEGKTLPVSDISQLESEVNLAKQEKVQNTITTFKEPLDISQVDKLNKLSQEMGTTPIPTSVGPKLGGRQEPAVSVLSEESANAPIQVGLVEPTLESTGTIDDPVPEGGAPANEVTTDQQVPQGGVPITGIAGTAAEPGVVRSAVYHKTAIAIFFNSAENPMWDQDLSSNILASNPSTQEALEIMNNIVESEGAQILVSDVKTNGEIQELIEILQLHFSLHRNMSKGNRVPTVGIPLGSLMSAFASPVIPNTPTQDISTQPIAQSIQPTEAVPTSVDLAKAWENRKDWGGGIRSGPSSNYHTDIVEQNTRIKIYNEVQNGLEAPRIRGIQLLRVQLEDHDC